MTSTILSSGIIDAIIMCHNGSLGMKLAHLLFLCVFIVFMCLCVSCDFEVFIKIHEYAN